MTKQYIGARYVPIIMGEYDSNQTYEPLSIVVYLNSSYTSKKRVPAGILPTNSEYWALTGNYNAQLSIAVENVVYQFDTMTEVISSDVAAGSLVYVKGYASINDGGAGYFYIENTQETYSVALASGRYATLLYDDSVNAIALGALVEPSILNNFTDYNVRISLEGKSLTLTSNINVANLENGTINANGYTVTCNTYKGRLSNLRVVNVAVTAATYRMVMIGNQEIKVLDCFFETSAGICLAFTSVGALHNITYNVTVSNCYFNGGNYGIAFCDDVTITQCQFSNIKMNYIATAGITNLGTGFCIHHAFTNVSMEPGANAIGIDLSGLNYCEITNYNCFNDAGGTIAFADMDAVNISGGNTRSNLISWAGFGYSNNITNCNVEGVVSGKLIFRNNFTNVTISDGEQHRNISTPFNLAENTLFTSDYYPISVMPHGYTWTQANPDGLVLDVTDIIKKIPVGQICSIIARTNGVAVRFRLTDESDWTYGGAVNIGDGNSSVNFAFFEMTDEILTRLESVSANIQLQASQNKQCVVDLEIIPMYRNPSRPKCDFFPMSFYQD